MWYALDPLWMKWQRLPPMPYITAEDEDGSKRGLAGIWMWNMVGSSIKIADAVRGWLGWKDTLDRMPFCGCGIGAVDGCLYVPGGFSKASAMSCVRRYDPILNAWSEYSILILVYGPKSQACHFRKLRVLPTALLRDLLKPIATGMTSYRGKLYVPQSLYYWQFFVDVGGEMYDPETNSWVDMPVGMGEGWPARQGGTKLSVIVNGNMYAFDPSSSQDSAKIKVYDYED
ncbi:hypothetical protein F0562_028960 [Nyssa sinensis]|uniref:Uncharacterized protein n=1 Tax=Nyssa sinensis TaxID=561372 RepID=A0A5J5B3M7_9ASTE|nr:hypothetical protein F0562_028960 [Nyssa sinensis]